MINENAILVLREGASTEKSWQLAGQDIIIGREEDCEVVVSDRQASRKHARIFRGEDGFYLQDLGSKNGTFLNGQDVHETPMILKDGDIIGIALCAKFSFVDAGATTPLFFDYEDQPSISVDTQAKRVLVKEVEITPPLSSAQFKLLAMLFEKSGMVIDREEVVRTVWSDMTPEGISDQAIDALARRLRERISEIDPDNEYLVTVRGHGFRLDHCRKIR